jgi:predicted transposase YbfD/YdcC
MSFWHCSPAQSTQGAATGPASGNDAGISSLLAMLESIQDPRMRRGKQHALEFVLAVCVVATLAGAKGYSEIARKANDMSQSLLAKLGAKWNWHEDMYKWPSKGTIRLVLSRIDADGMDAVTGEWLSVHAAKNADGEWDIAVDGKVLRGAWTSENDKVTLFSAMIREEGITIAQVRVPDDTNEITQVGALLGTLPIPEADPALFTLDAAHTQAETAEIITRRPGWDYLMNVKGNRPSLMQAVFDKTAPLTTGKPDDIMEDRSRGHLKRWSCWISDAEGIDFPGVRQVAIILREVFEVSGDKASKEVVLALTSRGAEKMNASTLNFHERSHWGIENKSHYVRDTVYREDHGQEWHGNGPQALAALRNLAIGLIHLKGVSEIKETTEWIAGDKMRALSFMEA